MRVRRQLVGVRSLFPPCDCLRWSSGSQPVCRHLFLLPDLEVRMSGLSAGAFSCQAISPVPQCRPLEGSQSSVHSRNLDKVWPREQLSLFQARVPSAWNVFCGANTFMLERCGVENVYQTWS